MATLSNNGKDFKCFQCNEVYFDKIKELQCSPWLALFACRSCHKKYEVSMHTVKEFFDDNSVLQKEKYSLAFPLNEIYSGNKKIYDLVWSNLEKIAAQNEWFGAFWSALQKNNDIAGNFILCGGAVRDFLLGLPPKDLDFVFINNSGDPSSKVFDRIFQWSFGKDYQSKITNKEIPVSTGTSDLGSKVLNLNGTIVDIWDLQDSWPIKNKKEAITTFQSLIYCFPFSSDLLYVHNQGEVFIGGDFKLSVANKTIYDYNSEFSPDQRKIARRAIRQAYKYGWNLSTFLTSLVKKHYPDSKLHDADYLFKILEKEASSNQTVELYKFKKENPQNLADFDL